MIGRARRRTFCVFVSIVSLSLVLLALSLSTLRWYELLLLKRMRTTSDGDTETKSLQQFQLQAGQGDLKYKFSLSGVMPSIICSDPKNLTEELGGQKVETSILFRFSPLVNDHVRSMFAPHVTREIWFAVYPFQVSCFPRNRSRLYCALRVWFRLAHFKEFVNRYQDSVFYALELDNELNYVPNSGHLINIPSPIHDSYYTGPEDPRVIMVNESLFINFINSHVYLGEGTLRRQFIWSVDKSNLHNIEIPRYTLNTWEKNWTPWIVNDTFQFIYQLLPETRILHCPLTVEPPGVRDNLENCDFTAGAPTGFNLVNTGELLLRGGSPLVHYTGNYFIAITHSVQQVINDGKKVYAAQLILFNGPATRVIFVSSPIFITPTIMKKLELTDMNIAAPFFYARSLLVEDADNLVAAGGVNDNESFIVRISGVSSLLNQAIKHDQQLLCESSPEHLLRVNIAMENWIQAKNIQQLNAYIV